MNNIMKYDNNNYDFDWEYVRNDDYLVLYCHYHPNHAQCTCRFIIGDFVKNDINDIFRFLELNHKTIINKLADNYTSGNYCHEKDYFYGVIIQELENVIIQAKALISYKENKNIEKSVLGERSIYDRLDKIESVLFKSQQNSSINDPISADINISSCEPKLKKEIKCCNKFPTMNYDKKHDVMHIFLSDIEEPIFGEDMDSGITVFTYDEDTKLTHDIVKFTIMDYTKNKDNFIKLYGNIIADKLFNNFKSTK